MVEENKDNSGVDTKATDWRSGLSEEFRAHPAFAQYDSLDKLAKTYINQEALIGKKSEIPKLGPDEDPKAWDEFYARAGRPEAPDKYDVKVADSDKALLDIFHKAGLNKSQAKKIYDAMSGISAETKTAQKAKEDAAYKKAYEDIVLKYGDEAKAKEILGQTSKFIEETVGKKYPEFLEFMRNAKVNTPEGETLLANHPVMAEAFRIISELTADDTINIKGVPAQSTDDAMAEFQKLTVEMANMDDRFSIDYQEKQKRYNLLKTRIFS